MKCLPMDFNKIYPSCKKKKKNHWFSLHQFTGKFSQIFKKDTIPVLYIFFQKTEVTGILPNVFCKTIITLILKPD